MRDGVRWSVSAIRVLIAGSVMSLILFGCDRHIESEDQSATAKAVELEQSHDNLWQVAGQSTLPKKIELSRSDLKVKELNSEEQHVVGRYSVVVPCTDLIARCSSHIGSVDLILNLMPNGSVSRLIKHLGKIQVDSRTSPNYSLDYWEVREINHKKYVVTYYPDSSLKFFYLVDSRGALVMDLARNRLENGKNYTDNYPQPLQAYHLAKTLN